jgi:WD40 repeat protein
LLIFNKYYELVKFIRDEDGINSLVNISNTMFASAGEKHNNIRIWTLKEYKCSKTLIGHESGIRSLLFIKKEGLLVSGSEKFIKVWDIRDYQCVKMIDAHKGRVTCFLLLPNGYFASGEDKKIKTLGLKRL